MKSKRKLDWATMLRELESFLEAYGHIRVEEQQERHPALAEWLRGVRGRLHTLVYKQIVRLDKAGFFDRLDERWLESYGELKAFKETRGHCRVPKPWPGNPPLANWVQTQRGQVGKMVPWRRKLLTDLEFDWDPMKSAWQARYRELLAFKREHGHTYVPATWEENPELAGWVVGQRHKRGKLSPGQIAMLEEAGFDWDPYETGWRRRYEELKAFHRKNGHCNVLVEKSALGKWVHKQRMKADKMPPHRRELLDEIGFWWGEKNRDVWMRRYEELKAYYTEHGHRPVPRESVLGAWVSNQRTAHRKRRMPPEREKLLAGIGFVWRVYPGR